ncbi:hypothetical protein ACP4OV_012185 [Aristida adscensionis]
MSLSVHRGVAVAGKDAPPGESAASARRRTPAGGSAPSPSFAELRRRRGDSVAGEDPQVGGVAASTRRRTPASGDASSASSPNSSSSSSSSPCNCAGASATASGGVADPDSPHAARPSSSSQHPPPLPQLPAVRMDGPPPAMSATEAPLGSRPLPETVQATASLPALPPRPPQSTTTTSRGAPPPPVLIRAGVSHSHGTRRPLTWPGGLPQAPPTFRSCSWSASHSPPATTWSRGGSPPLHTNHNQMAPFRAPPPAAANQTNRHVTPSGPALPPAPAGQGLIRQLAFTGGVLVGLNGQLKDLLPGWYGALRVIYVVVLMLSAAGLGASLMASASVSVTDYTHRVASLFARICTCLSTFALIVAISTHMGGQGYIAGIIVGVAAVSFIVSLWVKGDPDANKVWIKFLQRLKSSRQKGPLLPI